MVSSRGPRARPDPVRLEVVHQLLAAICEEAGALLQRSAISPNIRERRDFSVALFDAQGRLVAQAAHIPVHLGSAGVSVRAVRAALDLEPGDVAVVNDPYRGGTHLPDITLVRPVFATGRARNPDWFLVDRAHHADVGGAVAGSMGVARDLHGEGLVLPPVKLVAAGRPVQAVFDLIGANVRSPAERLIDLRAQGAALERAEARLRAMAADLGRGELERYAGFLMDYSERLARAELRRLPPGPWHAADALDDDGAGTPGEVPIRLKLTVERGALHFDWRGTAPQARGGINANPGVVLAACVYALRCLCPERLPTNEGLFRVVRVTTEPGSLLDPRRPAPVAGGNVETSQRLVDVAFQALAQALPGELPAASAGTMSNLTVGGDGFSIYETLPGGAGAGPTGAGQSAIQTHMTNTRNTPIEETELRTPLRIRALTVRRGSGGRGRHRGGDGLRKEIELLAPATVSLFAERCASRPPGVAGGAAGRALRARVALPGRAPRVLASKGSVDLPAGARVTIETPGGGGFGAP
ncbi:MAG: hydantoinase B/oxoprolinase family protein [Planctomycetes bacterium]|nr:hydantoinase B/oxoprolinase family protein [Planctomycetota bacterium]